MTTVDWLRGRDADGLVGLFQARPDLAVPAPGDLAVLARRVDTPPSVFRAIERLDRFHLQILQAAALLAPQGGTVGRAAILELIGEPLDTASVDRAADDLELLGLLRGGDPLHVAPNVHSSLGEFPAGLGPRGRLTDPEIDTALATLTSTARNLLDRLDAGQPRGSVPPFGPTREVVDGLVDAGLLVAVDTETVLLPREVSARLRGGHPFGAVSPVPPAIRTTDPGRGIVDATAAGQALSTLATFGNLLGALGRQPAPSLKAGGLGVRELRRLAKDLSVVEAVVALQVEIAAEANLIAVSDYRGGHTPAWTPTEHADEFAALTEEQAWLLVANTWWGMRRDPARVGRKDETINKVVNALSFDSVWTRGPAERRTVFSVLADVAPGRTPVRADIEARIAWLAPMRDPDRLSALISGILSQATMIGLVAFDALTTAGRALLADDLDHAEKALAASLPAPVDQVLVQADLTVVAPGRLDPGLAARLAQVADVESTGSAVVFRITQDSLRRALDAGVTADEIHELFARHSTTAVPQSLDYLIDDIARRHGVLRLGSAAGYLRSDDPALVESAVGLAQAAGLPIRRLAPTVAVSPGALEDLLEVLRQGGLVPAAEDDSGSVVSLVPVPHRTRSTVLAPSVRRESPLPSEDQLRALVDRMRAGEVDGEQSPSETVSLLRQAVDFRTPVWITYADADGSPVRRLIEPVAVSGGTVAAFDHLRQSVRTFALHRISGVTAG